MQAVRTPLSHLLPVGRVPPGEENGSAPQWAACLLNGAPQPGHSEAVPPPWVRGGGLCVEEPSSPDVAGTGPVCVATRPLQSAAPRGRKSALAASPPRRQRWPALQSASPDGAQTPAALCGRLSSPEPAGDGPAWGGGLGMRGLSPPGTRGDSGQGSRSPTSSCTPGRNGPAEVC